MNASTMFLALLMMGATTQVAEKLSSKYYWEPAHILVTRTKVEAVHQVEVMGYFSDAVFFSHEKSSAAKLGLLSDGLTDAAAVKYQQSTPSYTWTLSADELLKFLKNKGVSLPDDVYPYDGPEDAVFDNGKSISVKNLKQPDGYNVSYLLGRQSKTTDDETTTYSYPPADSSIRVVVGSESYVKGKVLDILVLAAGGKEGRKSEGTNYWISSKAAYGFDYSLQPLTISAQYQGLTRTGKKKVVAELLVGTHRFQRKGVVFIPSVDPLSDSLNAGEERHDFGAVPVSNLVWNNSASENKLSKFSVETGAFLNEFLASSSLFRTTDGQEPELSCVDQSQEYDRVCKDNGKRLELGVRENHGNIFWVTDEQGVRTWEVQVAWGDTIEDFSGDFHPVFFSGRAREWLDSQP